MDNFIVYVISREKEHFDKAMQIAFSEWGEEAKPTKAEYFRITPDNMMILYWGKPGDGSEPNKYMPLPYKMGIKEAINFVWDWYQNTDVNDPFPDIDGDAEKAFKVFNGETHEDFWTNEIDSYSIVAVKILWGIFHK